MANKPSGEALLNPNIKISIQGKALAPEAEADLISATISEDLEAPSMFELKFVTWDISCFTNLSSIWERQILAMVRGLNFLVVSGFDSLQGKCHKILDLNIKIIG